MVNSRSKKLFKERGFTLIELITCFGIISVLSGLAVSAFYVYQKDAHYARAVSDLSNALIAVNLGANDNPNGVNVGLTYTGIDGGPVPEVLREAMPGATTSPEVKLGAKFSECNRDGFTPAVTLISQPCKGDSYITYVRFCNGVDVRTTNIARDYACP